MQHVWQIDFTPGIFIIKTNLCSRRFLAANYTASELASQPSNSMDPFRITERHTTE